jgi:hypothetical protein
MGAEDESLYKTQSRRWHSLGKDLECDVHDLDPPFDLILEMTQAASFFISNHNLLESTKAQLKHNGSINT